MLSQPADLPDELIRAELSDGWDFAAAALSYQAVGFGSHHWLAGGADGQLFVTVDDLVAKSRSARDSTDAVFGRLDRVFRSALSLRRDCGLTFVVAPVPAAGGRVLARLADRYSLLVHPYLADCEEGHDGGFAAAADRLAVVSLLAELHRAAPPVSPPADDLGIPNLDGLRAAMAAAEPPWQAGPYSRQARDLLAAHSAGLGLLLTAYDGLAGRVGARADRMVVTHGEPHSANVLRTPAGFVIVDWDSALLAPPERDLWDLAESDTAVLAAYTAATGTVVDQDALTLYRMSYDLGEIAEYICWFRGSHEDSLDAAEAWRNLQFFLRPADRWPAIACGRPLCHAEERAS